MPVDTRSPTRTSWAERDAGQKLSLVMILLVMAAFLVFSAWSLVVDLGAGDLARAATAGVFVAIWGAWTFMLLRQLGMFDARG